MGLTLGRVVTTGRQEPLTHTWDITQLILRTGNQPAQGLGACLWIPVVLQEGSAGTRRDMAGVGLVGTPALAWPGPPEAPGLPWLQRGHLTYGMAFPGCHMGPFLCGLGWLLVPVNVLTPSWSQLCSALLSDCPTAHLPALFPVGKWPSSPPVQKRCLPRPPSSPVKVSRIGGRVTGPPHIARWFCGAGPCSLLPATVLPSTGTWNHRQLSFWPICGVTGWSG